MDLAHKTSSAIEMVDEGTTRSGRKKLAPGILTAVAVAAIFASALFVVSRINVGPATQADPLVGPAAIEFRAGERVVTSTQADPLLAPAAVEFRAGERQSTAK
jgi:hypothetical protein